MSLEIEAKFIIDESFFQSQIRPMLAKLDALNSYDIVVQESYFYAPQGGKVLRYTEDSEHQRLIVKDMPSDPLNKAITNAFKTRQETIIELLPGESQFRQVQNFCQAFGLTKRLDLEKKLNVIETKDAEFVFYVARSKVEGNDGQKKISCFEIEAKGWDAEKDAAQVIGNYIRELGLQCIKTEQHSLFELFRQLLNLEFR